MLNNKLLVCGFLLLCMFMLAGAACEMQEGRDTTTAFESKREQVSTSQSTFDAPRQSITSETTIATETAEETMTNTTGMTVLETEDFSFESELVEGDYFSVNYPVFASRTFPEVQDQFNTLLSQYAYSYWTLPEEYTHYQVSYEITGYNTRDISIVYSLQIDGNDHIQKHSLNLSLYTGDIQRSTMEVMEDGAGLNATYLWESDASCEILSEGVSNAELSEYLQSVFPDYDTFYQVFYNADNTSFISDYDPYWTYLSDEGVIVLIPVTEELGDYVAVKMVIGG